jgi:hypothetical protein
MKILQVACLIAVAPLLAGAQTSGWSVVRDTSNACQVSIPPDWKPDKGAWQASGADHSTLALMIIPGKVTQPMSEIAQQTVSVDKMIQNTSQLVLYTFGGKLPGDLTSYGARAPGKGGECNMTLIARKGMTEEKVKKIAATLGPAK